MMMRVIAIASIAVIAFSCGKKDDDKEVAASVYPKGGCYFLGKIVSTKSGVLGSMCNSGTYTLFSNSDARLIDKNWCSEVGGTAAGAQSTFKFYEDGCPSGAVAQCTYNEGGHLWTSYLYNEGSEDNTQAFKDMCLEQKAVFALIEK